MKRAWIGIAVFSFVLALCCIANAQETSSITGTVKDRQNGVLAGAKVTLTSVAIGVNKTTTSNAEGVFSFPSIPPGTYKIVVELSGFKRLEKSDIVLNTISKINAGDFALEVGDISATVEVTADSGQMQVQSESGERSDLVTGTQLQNIGLNGRNVPDLVKLIPGVLSSGFSGGATALASVSQFNINGTHADQHEVTVDGVTNFNLGNNTAELVTVNPDAVGEVRVETSNYSAEFGRSGGGFIAITTKGGTNEYHGGGRYYRRHDSMNANSYFNNARGLDRQLYRYNFYGWDFSGPVALPTFGKDGKWVWSGKNRLYFFINQEYDRQLVPTTATNIRVPTALERTGDFSQSVDGAGNRIYIKDPLLPGTCTAALQATNSAPCFPNGVIPANRLYAPGLAALRLPPLPNVSGVPTYNYTSQISNQYPRRETVLRIDYQATSSLRISGRWTNNQDDQQFNYGTTTASWNWPLAVTHRRNGPGNVLSFSAVKNFGSTWINEFIFATSRGGVTIAPEGDAATQAKTGITTPLLFPSANTTGLIPSLNFGAIPSSNATANTSVFGPFVQTFVINNFIDNLTKIWGNHNIKVGVYEQRAENISNSQNHVQSDIDFSNSAANPLNTGYGFANAALGVFTSYTQASLKLKQDNFYHDLSFYAQDSWKVTRTLTLELGLRLSHFGTYINKLGPEGYFDPTLFKASDAMRLYRPVCVGASTCTNTPANINAGIYRGIDPNTVGPATAANTVSGLFVGKLIPGSGSFTNGLGLTTNGYPAGSIMHNFLLPQPRLGFAWDVTGKHTTIVRGGAGIAYDRYRTDVTGNSAQSQPFVLTPTLSNGFLQDITPAGPNTILAPGIERGVDRSGKFPSIYSYSIGIQHQLWGTVFDVAYVGSQTRHNVRTTNINNLPLGAAFQASAQNPTSYAGGVIPASEPGLPTIYSAAGANFTSATALPIDFLRPYQGYTDINYVNFDGNASYNSLQVSVQRRFAKDLTLGGAYTFSKTTTTANDTSTVYTPNNFDRNRFDRQLANFDRRHFFSANFVWNTPKIGNRLGNNMLSRAVFDNWTLSGTTFIATGTPAELGFTISGVDAVLRYLGMNSSSGLTPRLLLNGSAQGDANQINISNFTIPGILNVGPFPRTYLTNPGFKNQDLALSKKFPLFGKDSHRNLQFRVEAFNVFNWTEFSGVNRTLNFTNGAGQTGSAIFNNYTGLSIVNPSQVRATSSNPNAVLGQYFGEYNATRDPRIVQLVVRLNF